MSDEPRTDLRSLGDWLLASEWPALTCPECRVGILQSLNLEDVTSAASERWRDDENFEPDWIMGHFYGSLRCNRESCNEPVLVSGQFKVDTLLEHGHWYGGWANYYKLLFAAPPLVIMAVPAETPSQVQESIKAASSILWVDPSSAANRLRVAAEDLLTARRVRRYQTGRGRRHALTLHERIDVLRSSKPEVADTLEAVKWIGNQGSHERSLTVSDVLHGASLLERALRLLYDQSDAEVARLARAVNRSRRLPRKLAQRPPTAR